MLPPLKHASPRRGIDLVPLMAPAALAVLRVAVLPAGSLGCCSVAPRLLLLSLSVSVWAGGSLQWAVVAYYRYRHFMLPLFLSCSELLPVSFAAAPPFDHF